MGFNNSFLVYFNYKLIEKETICPIKDLAQKAGLPDCELECTQGLPEKSGPMCLHTSNDQLFPVVEMNPHGEWVKVFTVEKDMLTILSEINI